MNAMLQAQIKWVTNVEDLRKALSSGTDSLVAMEASVEKTARRLGGEGLLRAANNSAAAVEKLGGVTKLTASEQANIHDQLTRAIAKYDALGQTAPSALTKLAAETRNASHDTEAMQKKLDGFASTATSVGLGLTAGVTAPIVAVGAAAIKLGMDAVESENLVSVSFGDMKASADAWAAGLSKNLGLNKFETEKMAGVLFNMTTGMGIAKDKAFEMSTGVVKLAADMASFRNIPMDEALTKIKSGLTGEAEPLKAIGILVDDATIKTYAYANGIAKQGQELTQQQKVMARWGTILQQTTNDQGDLARTLESPANQLRIMKSRVEEATTALGVQLIPIVSKVIGGVSQLVPYLQTAVEWFGQLPEPVQTGVVVLAAIAAAAGPVILVLGGIASGLSTVLPLVGGLAGVSAAAGTALGVAVPVAMAFGAAVLGWQIGRAIADVFDLDNKIAGLVVRLGLVGDVKAQEAAAKMDTLRLATQHAGRTITDYTEAIRINQQWAEEQVKRNTRVTDTTTAQASAYQTLKAEAQGLLKDAVTPLTANQRELALMFDKGGRSAKEIADKLGVSEEAIKRVTEAHKKAVTEGEAHAKRLREIAQASEPLTLQQKVQIVSLEKLGISHGKIAEFIHVTDAQVSKYTDSLKENAKTIADIGKQITKIPHNVPLLLQSQDLSGLKLPSINTAAVTAASAQRDIAAATFNDIEGRMHGLGVSTRAELERMAAAAKTDYEQMRASGLYTADQLQDAWQRMTDANRAVQSRWVTGLQDAVGQFASMLSSGGGFRSTLKNFGTNFAKDFTGQMLAFIPGIGPMISQFAGPLVDGAKKLFGKLFDGNKGRDLVNDFAKTFDGGFDGLHQQLGTLGAEGELLWVKLTQGVGRNNPEQARTAIEQVTAALANHKSAIEDTAATAVPSLADMQAAAERYGGKLEDLGPKVQSMQVTDTAQKILADFKLLEQGGADLNGVYEMSKDEIHELLVKAQKTGAELPKALQPYLQEMANAGLLTDDAGNKLTDLSSFKFSEDLPTAIGELVTTMKDFIATVTGPNGAVDAITRLGTTRVQPIRVPVHYEPEDAARHHAGTAYVEKFHAGIAKVLPFRLIAHNGLLPDEVPAILQPGDATLSPRAAAALGPSRVPRDERRAA